MFEKTRIKYYSSQVNTYLVQNSTRWVENYGPLRTTYSLFAARGDEEEYWYFIAGAWQRNWSYELTGTIVATALWDNISLTDACNHVREEFEERAPESITPE
jgi:hypothetical protein